MKKTNTAVMSFLFILATVCLASARGNASAGRETGMDPRTDKWVELITPVLAMAVSREKEDPEIKGKASMALKATAREAGRDPQTVRRAERSQPIPARAVPREGTAIQRQHASSNPDRPPNS